MKEGDAKKVVTIIIVGILILGGLTTIFLLSGKDWNISKKIGFEENVQEVVEQCSEYCSNEIPYDFCQRGLELNMDGVTYKDVTCYYLSEKMPEAGVESCGEISCGNVAFQEELISYGEGVDSPDRVDIRDTKCLVLIGSHIGENMHNGAVQEMSDAIDKGATIITVDPRYSTAASKSKYWLSIKPATDNALLLAWINVIINEKLYDRDLQL